VSGRRGANAIEFAILMPVLFAVITGIVDYSWIFTMRNAAMHAARAGARAGSVTARADAPDSRAAEAAAEAWAGLGLTAPNTIIAFRVGTPELMTVRMTVDVVYIFGLVYTPSTIQLTAVELMEQQS
jgi:Flp pilus assembly protein TadG